MGRTARRRKRPKVSRIVNVSHDPAFLNLQSWLKQHNFIGDPCLRPAIFPDTGRGLQSRCNLEAGDTIVHIPLSAVISRAFVESSLCSTIQVSHISTQTLLSLWLLHEKSRGDTSIFGPYLDSLPTHYTNPYFCSAKEKLCLPQSLSEKVMQQEDVVIKNYQQLLGLTKQLSWALTPSMLEFSWAWFTVNTRAVYLDSDPRWPQRCSTHSPSPTDDNLALVPYLDLLNHTSEVEVTAGIYPAPLKSDFDVRNAGYRIVTHTPVKKNQQAFINYGPHDNSKLMLEYGFWLPSNRHEMVEMSLDWLLDMLSPLWGEHDMREMERRRELISKYGLDKKLGVVEGEGVTWSVGMIIKIMQLDSEKLHQDCYDIFDEEEGDSYSDLVTRILDRLAVKISQELEVMEQMLTDFTESFELCHRLTQSHLRIVKKAQSHVDTQGCSRHKQLEIS